MNKSNKYTDEGTMNILDYISILRNHGRFILISVACAFILSVAVSLLLPKSYMSTASIFPPQRDSLMGSGVAGAHLEGGLGALATNVFGFRSTADIWVGILKSASVSNSLIEQFNLKEYYGVEATDDARRVLASRVNIEKEKNEIIHISVEDRSAAMAAAIANAFAVKLDELNRKVSMSLGKNTRVFIGKRLEKARADLKEAEDAARRFQETNKAVKLDEQSKAVIEAMAGLKGKIISLEVQLTTLLTYATPDNPEAQLLRREIDELKVKLSDMDHGVGAGSVFLTVKKLPSVVAEYVRLLRDVKVQEVVYELLVQQYEMALIQEAKDSPTVQILDVATPPERRSKPKRTKVVFLFTMSAAVLSALIAFFREYLSMTKETRRFTSGS